MNLIHEKYQIIGFSKMSLKSFSCPTTSYYFRFLPHTGSVDPEQIVQMEDFALQRYFIRYCAVSHQLFIRNYKCYNNSENVSLGITKRFPRLMSSIISLIILVWIPLC